MQSTTSSEPPSLYASHNEPAHLPQIATALAVGLGAFCMGSALGYTSPAGADLQYRNDTSKCVLPAGRHLNVAELSWFTSLLGMGAMIGAVLSGISLRLIGPRSTMLTTISAFMTGWSLIAFATDIGMLVAGRLFCGLCVGILSLCVPVYLRDIASHDIRGLIGSSFHVQIALGLLYSYSVGSVLCWEWLAIACLLPAGIFVSVLIFCKESPQHLVSAGRIDEARRSLQMLRGYDYNTEPELADMQVQADSKSLVVSVRALTAPDVLRPLVIVIVLMFFQQFSGAYAILFNIREIFTMADIDISADAAGITVAFFYLMSTAAVSSFLHSQRRKLLLLLSSTLMAAALLPLGTYFYLLDKDQAAGLAWLPITSYVIYFAAYSVGLGPIPWVLMGESFPLHVRDLAENLGVLSLWFHCYISTLLFRPIMMMIGLSGAHWFFAIICLCCLVFSGVVVKETSGKNIQEISAMFDRSEGVRQQ
ncbi:Major facilitator sugar transporter-like [Trinorchestia longiramus]|nr:Major facilitator sugar transporter-like [Trinorchestia longiramus]